MSSPGRPVRPEVFESDTTVIRHRSESSGSDIDRSATYWIVLRPLDLRRLSWTIQSTVGLPGSLVERRLGAPEFVLCHRLHPQLYISGAPDQAPNNAHPESLTIITFKTNWWDADAWKWHHGNGAVMRAVAAGRNPESSISIQVTWEAGASLRFIFICDLLIIRYLPSDVCREPFSMWTCDITSFLLDHHISTSFITRHQVTSFWSILSIILNIILNAIWLFHRL